MKEVLKQLKNCYQNNLTYETICCKFISPNKRSVCDMLTMLALKNLMEIDEWVSKRETYSYTLAVFDFGYHFWVFDHKTEEGKRVQSVKELEDGGVCEKSEEAKSTISYDAEQNGITLGTNA